MVVYDKIASDQSVFLMNLSGCLFCNVRVCLYLQTMTLTWLGRVSSHQGGHHAALVCSKKVHIGHDMTQRKPVDITSNTGTTLHQNKSCFVSMFK